jgi:uncharacterized OB-fold protein
MKKQRYALVGEMCPKCETYQFPPRAVCPVCAEQAQERHSLADRQPVMAMAEALQPVGR